MSSLAFITHTITANLNHDDEYTSQASCPPRSTKLQPQTSKKEQKPYPDLTIPKGAHIEQTWSESPLLKRLDNLRFAYETDEPPCNLNQNQSSPCTLRYRCRAGHVVKSHVGSPACKECPICMSQGLACGINTSRRKLSLCELGTLAEQRGGALLSTEYQNARTPLLWRCSHGHIWRASATNIRSANSWCPECARQSRKLSIEDMRELAEQFGGLCLSDEYISEHVKLKWQCEYGHQFLMAPNNIRRSATGKRKPSWCKICRKMNRNMNRQHSV